MINSRSDKHPDWVQDAIDSVNRQSVDCELIVLNNIGRHSTIGKLWNEGVKRAKYDYVFFLGDDDWIADDYLVSVLQYILNHPNFVLWTTNMTIYDEENKLYAPKQQICTGTWKKEYLLRYPFNENLEKGIDREYLQEVQKRGDRGLTIPHNFGYYYRKHSDYSCAGKLTLRKDKSQIYVLTSSRNFIDPLVSEWRKEKTVYVTSEEFNPQFADEAEVIWCEWLTENAIRVSQYECKAKKFLRIHSYEAFSPLIHYVDFSKFDKVIFIAEHIKKYVESKVGNIPNAIIIPVGVDLEKFKLIEKEKNNKICYAGEISRKKGIGELFLIAKEFPKMEFHIAGKFKEDDVAWWFNEKKPDNVFLYPYSYDLQEFFKDKTYFINTSLREGNPVTVLEAMACGLKPLISDWVGADKIYGDYLFRNLDEFRQLLDDYSPKEYRKFAEQFDFKKTLKEINGYLSS